MVLVYLGKDSRYSLFIFFVSSYCLGFFKQCDFCNMKKTQKKLQLSINQVSIVQTLKDGGQMVALTFFTLKKKKNRKKHGHQEIACLALEKQSIKSGLSFL